MLGSLFIAASQITPKLSGWKQYQSLIVSHTFPESRIWFWLRLSREILAGAQQGELSEFCLGLQEPLAGWSTHLAGKLVLADGRGFGSSPWTAWVSSASGLPSPGASQETEVKPTVAFVTPIMPPTRPRVGKHYTRAWRPEGKNHWGPPGRLATTGSSNTAQFQKAFCDLPICAKCSFLGFFCNT